MADYYLSDEKDWKSAGLKDPCDFSECVEYVNQSDDYCDSLRGEWFYPDDDTLTIYFGSFSNSHSPFCSCYTYANVYDTKEEYQKAVRKWESYPEYLPQRDEQEENDDVG